MSSIRVFIADDHAILRSGLRLLLDAHPGIEVVGEAEEAETALAKCRELHPDVLTLDLSMRGASPLKVLPLMRAACPEMRVLVLTMHNDTAYLRAAKAAGCHGYLLKSAADEELVAAIREVMAGRFYVDLAFDGKMQGVVRDDPGEDRLSERERQVLELLAYGLTNQEIAKRLFLSVKTVETYRARVLDKLRLKTRADVVRYTLAAGILDPNRVPPNFDAQGEAPS